MADKTGHQITWYGNRQKPFRIGHVTHHCQKFQIVSIRWDTVNPDFMPLCSHWTESELESFKQLGHCIEDVVA